MSRYTLFAREGTCVVVTSKTPYSGFLSVSASLTSTSHNSHLVTLALNLNGHKAYEHIPNALCPLTVSASASPKGSYEMLKSELQETEKKTRYTLFACDDTYVAYARLIVE